MTQKWLIVERDVDADTSLVLCEALGCNGFYSGIPPFLEQVAKDEGWVLPHVWSEPDPVSDTVEISA